MTRGINGIHPHQSCAQCNRVTQLPSTHLHFLSSASFRRAVHSSKTIGMGGSGASLKLPPSGEGRVVKLGGPASCFPLACDSWLERMRRPMRDKQACHFAHREKAMKC